MKILQVLPKIPFPPTDGHKKSMWGVIKYLSQLGHEIEIIAYRQNENPEKVKTQIEKYAKLHVLDVSTPNSLSGALKNFASPIPYNLSKYRKKELKEFLYDFLRGNKFDIIHITNSHMGWIVDEVRKLSNAPVVLRQENLELTIMERYYRNQTNPVLKLFSYFQYKKFLRYEPALCSKFDRVIMMNGEDSRGLQSLNPYIKCSVIPLGVEKELLSLKNSEEEKLSIAHIGSLNWYPNLDGFLWFVDNIFPSIVDKKPGAKLYIYGSDLPKKIRIREDVRNNIIVKGFVGDVWNELANKALVVIPLRIGSGIRVKILELLAAGKFVVTTSIGKEGIPAINKKELLIADNEMDFVKDILDCFDHKYNTQEITSNGRKLVEENYLWEIIARRFEILYSELVTEKTK
ncbi:MAG: glycosyltransferase family 4 protein [Bacteroidota bacterium]